jgi:hypothetical protein
VCLHDLLTVPWRSVALKTRWCVPSPFEIIFSPSDLSCVFQIAIRQNGDKVYCCLAQTRYVVSSDWDWRTMLLPKIFCSRILTMIWFLQTLVRVKGRPIWRMYKSKKTLPCEVVLQEYCLTITNCYLCMSLPTNMPWHQGHNDPISPHAFICALSQVKDKHNDAMSFSSLAHKLQLNMTHTLLGIFCGWYASWMELKHLVRPDVLL